MKSLAVLSSNQTLKLCNSLGQKIQRKLNIRTLFAKRVDVMSLVEYYDRVLEVKRTSLEETPIQQIVKRQYSKLTFFSELFRQEIRTSHLSLAVFFELLELESLSRSPCISHLLVSTQFLPTKIFAGFFQHFPFKFGEIMINAEMLPRSNDVEMAIVDSFFKFCHHLTDLRMSSSQIVHFLPKRSVDETRKGSDQKAQGLSCTRRAFNKSVFLVVDRLLNGSYDVDLLAVWLIGKEYVGQIEGNVIFFCSFKIYLYVEFRFGLGFLSHQIKIMFVGPFSQNSLHFIIFTIKTCVMSNMSCHLKTEEAAKKHGRSSNQKSNFKYLMNGKTIRTARSNLPSKENEIESVILNSAHKYAIKTARVKTFCQESQPLIAPISSFDVFLGHCATQLSEPNLDNEQPESIEEIKHAECPSICLENDELLELISNPKIPAEGEQKQKSCGDFACMTEECYYTKQLQIKIQLLKKERDDIWNSIAETIQQNMTLKEIIANFTINKKTTRSTSVQTDPMAAISTEMQTEVTSLELVQSEISTKRIENQLFEAKILCSKIVSDDQEIEGWDLKSLISEALNLNLNRLIKQCQYQKQLLVNLHQQEVSKCKQMVEKRARQIGQLQEEVMENKKTRKNMEKLYLKELEEINLMVQMKQKTLEEEINRLRSQFASIEDDHERQNQLCLQYVQSASAAWSQKQRLYSALLSQAHKTIRSLMAQMKQFESMANQNYSKYLRSQRSQIIFKMMENGK